MKLTKKKRLEKAKVKIRAKKLRKGHNVTDTSFKAKKIVIRHQLKPTNDQEILTKKSCGVQELLGRLDPSKFMLLKDALIQLKELFINYEVDHYNLYLPRAIDSVAKLITHPMAIIRELCVTVLGIILSKASLFQIEPHFKILRSHLMCGLTQLSSGGRMSALQLLNKILKYFPQLMINEASNILPAFLNLISTSKYSSKLERVLSVVPNLNMTEIHWRLRVLSVLADYFTALKSFGSSGKCNNIMDSIGNKTSAVIHWDGKSPLYIGDQLKHNIIDEERGYLPGILVSQQSGLDFRSTSVVESQKELKSLIESLMPILFDSWTEVAPKFYEKNVNDHIVLPETSVMLFYILEIILKLFESLENLDTVSSEVENMFEWFTNKYKFQIVSSLWGGFPYVLQDNVSTQDTKKTKKKNAENPLSFVNPMSLSPECVHQNLTICFLVMSFKEFHSTHTASVVQFVERCIKTLLKPEILPLLKKVLAKLFATKYNAFSKSNFASTIIKKCQKSRSACKYGLFSFLCEIFLSPTCSIDLRSKELSRWVANLPELLLEDEISFKVIEILRLFASQNHKLFIENLKKQRSNIIDSLCEIKLTECNELEGRKAIIDILFSVGDFYVFQTIYKKLKLMKASTELLMYVQNLRQSLLFLRRKRMKLHRSQLSKHES